MSWTRRSCAHQGDAVLPAFSRQRYREAGVDAPVIDPAEQLRLDWNTASAFRYLPRTNSRFASLTARSEQTSDSRGSRSAGLTRVQTSGLSLTGAAGLVYSVFPARMRDGSEVEAVG